MRNAFGKHLNLTEPDTIEFVKKNVECEQSHLERIARSAVQERFLNFAFCAESINTNDCAIRLHDIVRHPWVMLS